MPSLEFHIELLLARQSSQHEISHCACHIVLQRYRKVRFMIFGTAIPCNSAKRSKDKQVFTSQKALKCVYTIRHFKLYTGA